MNMYDYTLPALSLKSRSHQLWTRGRGENQGHHIFAKPRDEHHFRILASGRHRNNKFGPEAVGGNMLGPKKLIYVTDGMRTD